MGFKVNLNPGMVPIIEHFRRNTKFTITIRDTPIQTLNRVFINSTHDHSPRDLNTLLENSEIAAVDRKAEPSYTGASAIAAVLIRLLNEYRILIEVCHWE